MGAKPPRKRRVSSFGVAQAQKAEARLPGPWSPDAKINPRTPGVDVMINPTSPEAKELIRLAERMGIPPEDAISRVLKHLTDQELSEEDAIDLRRLVKRLSA